MRLTHARKMGTLFSCTSKPDTRRRKMYSVLASRLALEKARSSATQSSASEKPSRCIEKMTATNTPSAPPSGRSPVMKYTIREKSVGNSASCGSTTA
jgi:hypothetical protein